jgi:hypothetical protein
VAAAARSAAGPVLDQEAVGVLAHCRAQVDGVAEGREDQGAGAVRQREARYGIAADKLLTGRVLISRDGVGGRERQG